MSLSNSCHCSTLCLTGHCVQYRDGIVISTAAVNFTLRRPEVLLTALGAVVPSRWAIEMSRHVQGASQETQTFMIIKDGIAMAATLYTFAGSVAWIHIIGTRPAVQRQGYCRLMLAALQEHVGGGTLLCVESTSSMAEIWKGIFGFTGRQPAAVSWQMFRNTVFLQRPRASGIAAAKAAALAAVWAKM